MYADSSHCRPFSLTVERVPREARYAAVERFGMSLRLNDPPAGGAEVQADAPRLPVSTHMQADTMLPGDSPSVSVVATALLTAVDSVSLEMALMSSCGAYIELTDTTSARDDLDVGDAVWAAASLYPFFLSLTTETLVHIRGAMVICNILVARGILSREQRANVELCLQEAIANAVVHGNLGVPSNTRHQERGYRVFSHMIGERLHVPELRRRRVDIAIHWDAQTLTIGVADQGSGYDLEALRRKRQENSQRSPSGRGFLFMQALTDAVDIGDGGRRITLRFSRSGRLDQGDGADLSSRCGPDPLVDNRQPAV